MDAPFIQIGGQLDKETAKNLGDVIVRVFAEGRKAGMDQETICVALRVIEQKLAVHNTAISSCTLTGDKNQS